MKALITGASSGIGREMARQLSAMGIEVILVARRLTRLQALREELGEHAQVICMDLRDEKSCRMLYERVKAEEIDAATDTLREARLTARTKADVSALEEIIAYANSLDQSGYTTESAQALIQNLARAEQMTADPEITQEEVNDMFETLQASVDELVEVNNSTSAEESTSTAAMNTTNAMFALMLAAGAAAAAAYRRKKQ